MRVGKCLARFITIEIFFAHICRVLLALTVLLVHQALLVLLVLLVHQALLVLPVVLVHQAQWVLLVRQQYRKMRLYKS